MGFLQDIQTDLDSIYRDSGQAITYTPVGGGAFPCLSIMPQIRVDRLEDHIVRDLSECRVMQSDLASNGVTAPTPFRERQEGDVVTIPDQNGMDEDWNVIDSRFSYGEWVLVIERNVRIVP